MNSSLLPTLRPMGVCDITTTGRRTGLLRRIEIVYHVIDGRVYISGQPNPNRKRSWLSNLEADPHFIFHVKGPEPADIPATARVIDDPAERRAILEHVARNWRRTDLDFMVAYSPLIEVAFDEASNG